MECDFTSQFDSVDGWETALVPTMSLMYVAFVMEGMLLFCDVEEDKRVSAVREFFRQSVGAVHDDFFGWSSCGLGMRLFLHGREFVFWWNGTVDAVGTGASFDPTDCKSLRVVLFEHFGCGCHSG